ncbi:hypothetical protein SASPL_153455 [Salvia splendens]|uniref:Uncharacterized protein n=1 Tax=Salvia splendens TaxID=180675 RepID=A0A8X8W514_SALSN|nr:hypothetical protein SASPL_153455 [Salvia splendens]
MKSGEEPGNLGEKLRRVGKRGGHTTPVASFWRLEQQQEEATAPFFTKQLQDIRGNPCQIPFLSARKLAATLWDLDQMHHAPLPRLRRLNHEEKSGLDPDPEPDLPESSSSLRRHIAATLMQHHRSAERNNRALQPVSPASYGSSMEVTQFPLPSLNSESCPLRPHGYSAYALPPAISHIVSLLDRLNRLCHLVRVVILCDAFIFLKIILLLLFTFLSSASILQIAPYNPAVTPTSSIEFKGRAGETSYGLRTSTELLKVLNRIWSLEEQHVSNMSLVKALKKELDHARSHIKALVREQQADRREMDELMVQIAEEKVARKSKEQDRMSATIQSLREELEDERKLRKRSESLHRKLAREVYDVKTTLAKLSKEVESERRSHDLMEDLCDEFALGIRGYERELRALRKVSDKDWTERADHDQLILHLSETWLDERMQKKLEGVGRKKYVVDKLSSEIEAFVQAKSLHNANGSQVVKDPTLRRSSLESIPLNMAVSAPQDEDDSGGSDSNCFELERMKMSTLKSHENEYHRNEEGETTKTKQDKKKNASSERVSPSALQVKYEEQIAQAAAHGESSNQIEDDAERAVDGPGETSSITQKPENGEVAKESGGMNSNQMIENLIRNHYMMSENGTKQPSHSVWRSQPSPVRHWSEKLPSPDQNASAESSVKLHPDLKENTLKAKLFEARTRGQRSRSRLKASIFPSRKE